MSQCEDIDVALANLNSATEAIKQRMNALEQKQNGIKLRHNPLPWRLPSFHDGKPF
ncbi:MAG: hypothetical protein HEQ35_06990 [Gloeotrichia echinulata IR180]|jgi:hypothetical protein|nr:hypothetical protein [Gloeotrichia echinulata DEX184]